MTDRGGVDAPRRRRGGLWIWIVALVVVLATAVQVVADGDDLADGAGRTDGGDVSAGGDGCRYWVAPAPEGDDDAPGTREQPWATLEHAAATVPDDGCTVSFAAGVYRGPNNLNRRFDTETTFTSTTPHHAVLEHDARCSTSTAVGTSPWRASSCGTPDPRRRDRPMLRSSTAAMTRGPRRTTALEAVHRCDAVDARDERAVLPDLGAVSRADPMIFGETFAAGAGALVVLAVGELVVAGTGICGSIIDMTGDTRLKLINTVVWITLLLASTALLVPRWGVLGAATASLIATGTINVVRLVQVWVVERLQPYRDGFWKTVLAAVVALGLGLVMKVLMPLDGSIVRAMAQGAVVIAARWTDGGARDRSGGSARVPARVQQARTSAGRTTLPSARSPSAVEHDVV